MTPAITLPALFDTSHPMLNPHAPPNYVDFGHTGSSPLSLSPFCLNDLLPGPNTITQGVGGRV